MTQIRAFMLGVAGVLAATLVTVSGWEADGVRLKTISTRMNGSGASLVIEATEPMAYVATRPDPLTLLVDFRDVDVAGVSNSVRANADGPITAVAVESGDVPGSTGSRVRVTLAAPMTHRIRSDRNTIVIDFDNAPAKSEVYSAQPVPSDAPDAMMALRVAAPTSIDPIVALGLNGDGSGAAGQSIAGSARQDTTPLRTPAPAQTP